MTERSSAQNSSLLALDIGSVNTRAKYFDMVEGSYRFLASGDTLSTINPPGEDLNIGAVEVLSQIEELTGFDFNSSEGDVIFDALREVLDHPAICTGEYRSHN